MESKNAIVHLCNIVKYDVPGLKAEYSQEDIEKLRGILSFKLRIWA